MTATPPFIDWHSGAEVPPPPPPTAPLPTLVTVVLDRSGSMENIKAATDSGFDEFVATQRRVGGVCKLTLAQFDDEYEVVYRLRDIADVPKCDLLPRGSTALLDAIGRTITQLEVDLMAMPSNNRPAKVIVLVLTDGFENASREWTRDAVRRAIFRHPEWDFVYIGADQDAITVGGAMGFNTNLRSASTATAQRGTYRGMSSAVTNSRLTGQSVNSYAAKNADAMAAAAMGDEDATKTLAEAEDAQIGGDQS